MFRITFDGLFSYRVQPVADDRLTPAALRVGMNSIAARVTARHATNAIEGPGPRETRPRPCGVDWAGVTSSVLLTALRRARARGSH